MTASANTSKPGSVRRSRSGLRRLPHPDGWLDGARWITAVAVIGLALFGLYQGLLAETPARQGIVVVTHTPVTAVDVWRSDGNGAVRLTTAAVVTVPALSAQNAPAPQRVLYDAPPDAKIGDQLHAWISLDGKHVRLGSLPGPDVLPGPQGAALLGCAASWFVLHLLVRRRSRRRQTESEVTP